MTDKQRFKEQFIVTFLATWCATNHADACMRDEHERLEHPPVEDAIELADTVWQRLVEVCE